MVGMAEGADLLVAEVALERGVPVDAVLPMPLDHYAEDFGAKSFELLRNLLQRAEVRRIELATPVQSNGVILDSRAASNRDVFYVNLRNCLIRKSALLLAVWDGESSPLPGGTADTVLRFLGAREDEDRLEEPIAFMEEQPESAGSRLVYWVPTGRSGGAAPEGAMPSCFLSGVGENRLMRHERATGEFAHHLRELNGYNREFEQLQRKARSAFTDTLMGSLPEDVPLQNRDSLEQLDAEYGKADALAMFYQERSNLLFKLFGYSTFSMGLLYLIYEKFIASEVLLVIYLTVLLSGLVLFHRVRGRHWFSKHLVYRVLAETMRVKFFLRLGAAERLVDARELIYLSGIDEFDGFGWIGEVVRSVEAIDPFGGMNIEWPQLDCVERAWIDNQQAYFKTKVATLERTSHRLKRLREILFVVILLVILVLILFSDYAHHTSIGLHRSLADLLTFMMGLIAIALAVWELYQNKMATRELLWQYRNQLGHFTRAKEHFRQKPAASGRKLILADLGKDSLMESYLWTIHRYHREHEPPT